MPSRQPTTRSPSVPHMGTVSGTIVLSGVTVDEAEADIGIVKTALADSAGVDPSSVTVEVASSRRVRRHILQDSSVITVSYWIEASLTVVATVAATMSSISSSAFDAALVTAADTLGSTIDFSSVATSVITATYTATPTMSPTSEPPTLQPATEKRPIERSGSAAALVALAVVAIVAVLLLVIVIGFGVYCSCLKRREFKEKEVAAEPAT